jgi:hypothetical protein
MSIVVYWLRQGQPFVQAFDDAQLLPALAFAEGKRKEKDDAGGYDWSKAHRGGPPLAEGLPKTLG